MSSAANGPRWLAACREGGGAFKVVNYVLLQAAWFGAVLSVAHDHLSGAFAVCLLVLAIHFALIRDRRRDLQLVAVAVLVGAVTETATRGLGAYTAVDPVPPPWPASWFLALWAVFGTTLRHCMAWLRDRWLLASAFGVVGGPLAVLGGGELGAVAIAPDRWRLWVLVGLQWALVLPLFGWVTARVVGPRAK